MKTLHQLEVPALWLTLLLSAAGYSLSSGFWGGEPVALFSEVTLPAGTGPVRTHPGQPRAPRLERLSTLLGLPLRDAAPGPDAAPSPEGCGARDTRLRLKLLGTLTHERGGLASLEDLEEGGRVRTVFLGSEVRGARLVEITRTRIVFLEDGCERELASGQAPAAPRASAAPLEPVRPAGVGGRAWERIVPIREGEYEFPRFAIDEAMAEGALTYGQVLPYIEGGTTKGFRVLLRPGSPYARLGLQSGDVLTRINGIALTSPEGALDAYSRLRDSQRVDLELQRAGQTVRRTYWIR